MKVWLSRFCLALTLCAAGVAYGQPPATTRAAGVLLTVKGEGVAHPLSLDGPAFAKMDRHAVTALDKKVEQVHFEGVPLRDLLKAIGLTPGARRPAVGGVGYCVVAEGADGYTAVFSMTEAMSDEPGHTIFVVDQREGKPLDAKEGPLRLVVPGDALPARSVRQLVTIRLAKP